jgi:hypothetical protein
VYSGTLTGTIFAITGGTSRLFPETCDSPPQGSADD